MPGQESKAKQVSSLGETPAQARARMQSAAATSPDASGGVALAPPPGVPLEVSEEIEGFGGGPAPEDAIVEERAGDEAAPTPSKAMEMIRQLGQDKVQLQTELDAAFNVIERYRGKYGDLEES
jgi:hypothetical protein